MIFRDGGAGRAGQAELTQQPWRHCTQASCGWQFSLPIIIAQKSDVVLSWEIDGYIKWTGLDLPAVIKPDCTYGGSLTQKKT